MSVLIVIVNYRTAGLAVDCLRSLEPEVAAEPGARVVVTDNASGDDSVARLEAAVRENGWGAWASVQPLGSNGGFAYGNNAAIRPALASADPPRYVWLLNPDTVVRPEALGALRAFLDGHPEVGIAGSRQEYPDGTPQPSVFNFPSVAGEAEGAARLRLLGRLVGPKRATSVAQPTGAVQVDWVSGASMMVRRDVFEAVGLLDERYFMYYEEVDLCRRARLAGWTCWHVPASRIVHLIGQSSGVSDTTGIQARRRPRYWFEARRRYFLTHHGRLKTAAADLAWLAAFAQFRARYALLGRPVVESKLLFWDFLRYNLLPFPGGTPAPARPAAAAATPPPRASHP